MGLKDLAEQFLKFGVVGALATVVDYGILMLLSQVAGWDPLPASVVSYLVSLAFNYLASMRYVFERRDDLSRRRELAAFVALSAVGLVITSLLIGAGTAFFGDGAVLGLDGRDDALRAEGAARAREAHELLAAAPLDEGELGQAARLERLERRVHGLARVRELLGDARLRDAAARDLERVQDPVGGLREPAPASELVVDLVGLLIEGVELPCARDPGLV